MATELSEAHRQTLTAICDTVVPAIPREPDPDGFWARRGSDLGADLALAELISELPPEQLSGTIELLDALGAQGFAEASQLSREQILRNVSLLGPDAAAGVGALVACSLFLAYGDPRPRDRAEPLLEDLRLPGADRRCLRPSRSRSTRSSRRAAS